MRLELATTTRAAPLRLSIAHTKLMATFTHIKSYMYLVSASITQGFQEMRLEKKR